MFCSHVKGSQGLSSDSYEKIFHLHEDLAGHLKVMWYMGQVYSMWHCRRALQDMIETASLLP